MRIGAGKKWGVKNERTKSSMRLRDDMRHAFFAPHFLPAHHSTDEGNSYSLNHVWTGALATTSA